MAILTLFQGLCRSPSVCELFIRDYRPLEVLFLLVCGPVSVSLKGCIFRTLAVIANATVYSGVPGSPSPTSSSSSSSSSSSDPSGAGRPVSMSGGARLQQYRRGLCHGH